MGGSCISRPKKQRNSSMKPMQNIEEKGQVKSIHTELSVPLVEMQINYPFFPAPWRLTNEMQSKVSWSLQQVKNKIKSLKYPNINANHYLPVKFYSYSGQDKQKYFSVRSKQNLLKGNRNNNLQQLSLGQYFLHNASLLQCVLFKDFEVELQIIPDSQMILLQKKCIKGFNEQTQFQLPSSKLVYINISQHGQLKLSQITQSDIKTKISNFNSYKQKALSKNCLINGFALIRETDSKQPGPSKSSKTQNNRIAQIINLFDCISQKQQVEGLLCYINPIINSHSQKQNINFECTTYLQYKTRIQVPLFDIKKLFDPRTILIDAKPQLPSIYILILSLKTYMQIHTQNKETPFIFLQELLTMKDGVNQILSKIISLIKLFYVLTRAMDNIAKDKFNQSFEIQVNNCCRNILQIGLVNSHVLIDAYFIQFSIQLNQKSIQVRQNPLLQPIVPIKTRIIPSIKHNIRLINQLKILSEKHLKNIIGCSKFAVRQKQQIQQEFKIWLKSALDVSLKTNYNIKNMNFFSSLENKENNLQSQDYNTNIVVSLQYYFGINVIKFLCKSFQLGINLFQIDSYSNYRKNATDIIKRWRQIVNPFLNNPLNFCSGEAAITILTFDGLIKFMETANNIQQCQQIILKALQIWFRIYRDPRAKYQFFMCNHWIVYLVNILLKLKNQKQQHIQNDQDIYYLTNILQCCNSQNKQLKTLQIIGELPLISISGIFYSKQQLFLPVEEQSTTLLMKTGSSLFENQNDNLSNKSNFSDSISNTNSQFGKKKRRNKKKCSDIFNLSEGRIIRNGIYQWGKNINSVPLLHPFSKNLQVLKISCSNYHVVVAASAGIFGWGQNGSGQLGVGMKQNIKTIKMILQRHIQSEKQIELSCGNQHTAILFKEKPLIMFGQQQGGIISGDGHLFDDVSCGGLHTLGLRKGKVFSWGRGEGGQLGHRAEQLKTKIKQQSTDFYLDEPKMINDIPNIKKSVCGDAHSVLLAGNGDVYVFGFCYQGQLGLGLTGDSDVFQIFQPIRLNLNSLSQKRTQVVDIFAGPTFTFFKTSEGEIFSCGLNDCFQLGQQKMMKVFQKKKNIPKQNSYRNQRLGESQYSRPKKIQIFNKQIRVNKIYCGENHCLASIEYLQKNRMIMGWGLNKQYQISNQFSSDSIPPRSLDSIYDYNFNDICCGSNFSLGLVKNQNRLGIHQLRSKIEDLIATTFQFDSDFSQK